MTATIEPVCLSLRRETSAPPYQLITRFLAGSEWTSLALRGSSTMIRSAPRPVSVPPTEVAYRLPPRVVMSSRPVSFAHRRVGKSAAYHSELTTIRNCRWSSAAKSPEQLATITRRAGPRPSSQATYATETQIDLSERGG